jgi:hypothetical protein
MVSWLNENGSLLKKLILFVIEIVHPVDQVQSAHCA